MLFTCGAQIRNTSETPPVRQTDSEKMEKLHYLAFIKYFTEKEVEIFLVFQDVDERVQNHTLLDNDEWKPKLKAACAGLHKLCQSVRNFPPPDIYVNEYSLRLQDTAALEKLIAAYERFLDANNKDEYDNAITAYRDVGKYMTESKDLESKLLTLSKERVSKSPAIPQTELKNAESEESRASVENKLRSVDVTGASPNDLIVLLRSTPLKRNEDFFKQGKPGEEFKVYKYEPATHKIYVLINNSGQQIPVNLVDADAKVVHYYCVELFNQVEEAFTRGHLLEALALSKRIQEMIPRDKVKYKRQFDNFLLEFNQLVENYKETLRTNSPSNTPHLQAEAAKVANLAKQLDNMNSALNSENENVQHETAANKKADNNPSFNPTNPQDVSDLYIKGKLEDGSVKAAKHVGTLNPATSWERQQGLVYEVYNMDYVTESGFRREGRYIIILKRASDGTYEYAGSQPAASGN